MQIRRRRTRSVLLICPVFILCTGMPLRLRMAFSDLLGRALFGLVLSLFGIHATARLTHGSALSFHPGCDTLLSGFYRAPTVTAEAPLARFLSAIIQFTYNLFKCGSQLVTNRIYNGDSLPVSLKEIL